VARIRLSKILAIAAVCIALSVALGVQALSNVATRSAPAQAVALFPVNGLAQEQFAFRNFQEQVGDDVSILEAARSTGPIARRGLIHDPLAPKSYAILAMAESDPERRFSYLRYANQINRRDLSLQSLVLQQHIENEDYPAVVSTLDQLLRVHPDLYDDLFPVLVDALKVDEAAPLFPSILNSGAAWHERFLMFAVEDEAARMNLASIRPDIEIDNPNFDRRLIAELARAGELGAALLLYTSLSVPGPNGDISSLIDWDADYPPFDWELRSDRDFRAQPSRDGNNLEIYARAGQGGVIARRIISPPAASLTLEASLTMLARGRSGGVRIVLRCGSDQQPVLDEVLAEGANAFNIAEFSSGCEQLTLEINARALRGEPTLRAELGQIEIEAR